MGAKIIKKVKEEYAVTVLNKPKQMLNMDLSGLNKFQHDIMDALLHNVQQTCKENSDGLYVVNILDIIKYVSDSKDGVNLMKQNTRIKESIDMLTSLKIINHDKYKISLMVVFPNIMYEKINGNITYRVNVDIDNAFKNGSNFIVDSRNSEIKPKDIESYYTRIFLDTYDKEDRKENHMLATKSIFQFICKNEYTFRIRNINTVTVTLEEIRALCGCNYALEDEIVKTKDDFGNLIEIETKNINYDNKNEKYPQYKDFKRYVLNKVIKEMKKIYGIPIEFHEIKFGKIVNKIDIVVDKDSKAYIELSKKMNDNINNIPQIKECKTETKKSIIEKELEESTIEIELNPNPFDIKFTSNTFTEPDIRAYKRDEILPYYGIIGISELKLEELIKSEDYNLYIDTIYKSNIDLDLMVTEPLFKLNYLFKLDNNKVDILKQERDKLYTLLKDIDNSIEISKRIANTKNYDGYVNGMKRFGLGYVNENDFNLGLRVEK